MYIKSFLSNIIFQSYVLSKNKYIEPEEVIYSIIIISLIIFILNIFGIIKLCQIDHKIKFEEWVLISGIIELILMNIFLNYKRYTILLTIVETLQIIIILFITRRFFKSYFLLSNSNIGSFCYNSFYIILIILNAIFTILSILLDLSTIFYLQLFISSDFLNNFISLIYDFFGLITSFILLIIGLKLKGIMLKLKQIEEENKEESQFSYEEYNPNIRNNNNDLTNENKETGVSDTGNFTIVNLNIDNDDLRSLSPTYFLLKETSKDIKMTPEIFFNIRIKQLNIYIWITLVTNFISFLISLFKIIFSNEFIKIKNGEIYPSNKRSYYIVLAEIINIIINTFMNWYTLYFVVRNTFPIKNNNKNVNVEESNKMINLEQLNKTNKSINDFLNID